MPTTPAPTNSSDREKFTDELFAWFAIEGHNNFYEKITQLAHALQSAELAVRDNAGDHQIVAALLHDIGHIVVDEQNSNAGLPAHDEFHEMTGSLWAKKFFGAAVAEPIRLHVPAKRWLCTTDEDYYDQLSEASKHSLHLQGNLMNREEQSAFEAEAYSKQAVKLRLWDDEAKVVGKQVPGLDAYRDIIVRCLV